MTIHNGINKVNKYTVYFSFNGKKMKMEVPAENKRMAEEYIYDKLEVHRTKLVEGIEPPNPERTIHDDNLENLKNLKNIFWNGIRRVKWM